MEKDDKSIPVEVRRCRVVRRDDLLEEEESHGASSAWFRWMIATVQTKEPRREDE